MSVLVPTVHQELVSAYQSFRGINEDKTCISINSFGLWSPVIANNVSYPWKRHFVTLWCNAITKWFFRRKMSKANWNKIQICYKVSDCTFSFDHTNHKTDGVFIYRIKAERNRDFELTVTSLLYLNVCRWFNPPWLNSRILKWSLLYWSNYSHSILTFNDLNYFSDNKK